MYVYICLPQASFSRFNINIGGKQKRKISKDLKVKTPALAKKVAELVNQAYAEYAFELQECN